MGSKLKEGMAALRRKYVQQLSATMSEIRQEWVHFQSGEDVGAAERLQRGVHRLAGSGATFGFPSLSDAALRLEERLDHAFGSDAGLDGDAVDDIEAGLERLGKTARRIAQAERGSARSRTNGRAAGPGFRA